VEASVPLRWLVTTHLKVSAFLSYFTTSCLPLIATTPFSPTTTSANSAGFLSGKLYSHLYVRPSLKSLSATPLLLAFASIVIVCCASAAT
jgi:hypothetical protein